MGKGVALEFRKRYPDMYADYVARCAAKQVRLGEPYLFRRPEPPWILNFPTKGHWRAVSRLHDIVAGLECLTRHYREWGITSLAIPPLGCGQGGLEWRVVGPVLLRYLEQLDIPVKLYAPQGTPQAELDLGFLAANNSPSLVADSGAPSKLNPAWVGLVEILARLDREPYRWPIGRVAFQKIAYFATQAGLPTGLRYARGSYGPFAPDLKSLVTRLVNNGLIREEQHGRMFAVRPGPAYQNAAQAYGEELARWEPEIERTVDLFLRVRTSQAEVAATAHFATAELEQAGVVRPSESEVLESVRRWKARRQPPLDDEDVALAIRNLHLLGWLNVRASPDLPLPADALAEA
jgi:uncharacterized protein YwgA